jgi:hypothetical protein
MGLIRFAAPAAAVTSLSGSSLATLTLSALGAEIDNTSARATHAFLELQVDADGAPPLGEAVEVYAVPCFDGTNYSDTVLNSAFHVATIPIQDVATAQRIAMANPVEIPPLKFKFAIYNGTSETLDTYTLKHRTTSKDVA